MNRPVIKPRQTTKVTNTSITKDSLPNMSKSQLIALVLKLERQQNKLEDTLNNLRQGIKKERAKRAEFNDRASTEHREVLRFLYEINPHHPRLSWISKNIEKNPNWGVRADFN